MVVLPPSPQEGQTAKGEERYRSWLRNLGDTEPDVEALVRRVETDVAAIRRVQEFDVEVDERPDRTLKELCDLSGKPCSIMAVARALDRLGGRYKKRRSTLASRTAQT